MTLFQLTKNSFSVENNRIYELNCSSPFLPSMALSTSVQLAWRCGTKLHSALKAGVHGTRLARGPRSTGVPGGYVYNKTGGYSRNQLSSLSACYFFEHSAYCLLPSFANKCTSSFCSKSKF